MAQELLFTSAPKGLKPGSSGPSTVLMSDSMPPLLMQRLEAISSHRSTDDGHEPIPSLSHVLVDMNGMRRHVVSRVAHAGIDHAGRSNHIAHHLVLHSEELGLGGPSWLVQQPVFRTAWDGRVAHLQGEVWLPEGPREPAHVCANWTTVAGDAGWAGVIAEAALAPSPKPVWIIHRRNVPVLSLLDEVVAIVPPRDRWKVTFSTQFTQPLPNAECVIRFCLEGSDAARAARHAEGLVLDLAAPGRLERSGGLIAVARTGRSASAAQAADTTPVAPVDLEPEQRGRRVVPMLQTKAATRIDPRQRQASMPAIDRGADSVDEAATGRDDGLAARRSAVPWLPWVVAMAVTAWAAIATVRIITTEPPAPRQDPLVEISPTDAERDGLRARIDELDRALRRANDENAALQSRILELEEAAARDRERLAERSARESESTADHRDEPSLGGDARSTDRATETIPPDGDPVLRRPRAVSGDQGLGRVVGRSISIAWPEGSPVDVAWIDGAITERSTMKRRAGLALVDGAAVWSWDALGLSGLSAEATEAMLDAVTAANLLIDGRQGVARIEPRTLTLSIQRKALVPKPIDLRTSLRLPWSGTITVQSRDGPVRVEPGRTIDVQVTDELGSRGTLSLTLVAKADRVTFAFTPEASLDQDALRRRVSDAHEAKAFIDLVREHDQFMREQPTKARKSQASTKARDAYDKYLADHLVIAEKIQRYRAQGLDDLKDQLARDTAAAEAEVAEAIAAAGRCDELRARWPRDIAEIAPNGGQGFVLVRVEATTP